MGTCFMIIQTLYKKNKFFGCEKNNRSVSNAKSIKLSTPARLENAWWNIGLSVQKVLLSDIKMTRLPYTMNVLYQKFRNWCYSMTVSWQIV